MKNEYDVIFGHVINKATITSTTLYNCILRNILNILRTNRSLFFLQIMFLLSAVQLVTCPYDDLLNLANMVSRTER